jgi:hypothetical protein
MTRKQFDYWLKELGKAWVEKNPQIIADICAPNIKYYETPFTKPYTSPEAVKKLWVEVPQTQKDITFKHKILTLTKKFGMAQFQAEFTKIKQNQRVVLDAVCLVELNKRGLCTLFKWWWVVK